MQATIITVTLTFLVSSSQAEEYNIPSYLQVCHRSDPKLSRCIQESIEKLRPKLENGIPDLLIPPCEPFKVPEIKLTQSSGPISVNSDYNDILVHGLSRFTVRNVRIDINKNKLRIKMWFPNLLMNARYTISGKIMMMPLRGEGPCRGNFTDIDATVFLITDRVTRDQKEYLKIEDVTVKFNIGGSNVQLENLFNGDAELGPAMNRFLNENWKSVAAEVRPAMETKISEMLKHISSKLFEMFTFDQLLPA